MKYPPVIKHGNGISPILFHDFPIKTSFDRGFSIATFDYKRIPGSAVRQVDNMALYAGSLRSAQSRFVDIMFHRNGSVWSPVTFNWTFFRQAVGKRQHQVAIFGSWPSEGSVFHLGR